MKEGILESLKRKIDEKRDENQDEHKTILISSPITGIVSDLSAAPDPAFAEGKIGEGAVITPTDPIVRAPEDGKVIFVFGTRHAVGFLTDSGVSILIHVGIDTVQLNGKGLEAFVESGQEVRKGDPLIKMDLDYLRAHAPSLASPVLFTKLEDNQRVRLLKKGDVKAGEPLFELYAGKAAV